jgi:hypothetical protein
LAELSTTHLNIRVNTNPSTVGSVRFAYNGNNNYHLENNSPYAFASDDDGNYNSWTPTLGSHTLKATPFSGSNGSGSEGNSRTLNFTVINQTSNTNQKVTSFSLINARTDEVVSGFSDIKNGDVIDLSEINADRLNIKANVGSNGAESVKFEWDGNSNFHYENNAPFALFKDDSGDYNEWIPVTGNHTLKATPYTQDDLKGSSGDSLSVSFTIQN